MRGLTGQATFQRLFLQDMPSQQLPLCVSQRFEFRAELKLTAFRGFAVQDACSEQQAEALRQENHLEEQRRANLIGCS